MSATDLKVYKVDTERVGSMVSGLAFYSEASITFIVIVGVYHLPQDHGAAVRTPSDSRHAASTAENHQYDVNVEYRQPKTLGLP